MTDFWSAVVNEAFWAQFLPDLVATLVGAFVGFFLALRVDHARERRSREAQEAALLQAARDAVSANLKLFDQIKPILAAAPPVPSFEMDIGLLDAAVPRLAELSSDRELLAQLASFRFQLHHVNRKLDHLLQVSLFGGLRTGSLAEANEAVLMAVRDVSESVMVTVRPLQESSEQKLLPLLAARIKKLEARRPWWMLFNLGGMNMSVPPVRSWFALVRRLFVWLALAKPPVEERLERDKPSELEFRRVLVGTAVGVVAGFVANAMIFSAEAFFDRKVPEGVWNLAVALLLGSSTYARFRTHFALPHPVPYDRALVWCDIGLLGVSSFVLTATQKAFASQLFWLSVALLALDLILRNILLSVRHNYQVVVGQWFLLAGLIAALVVRYGCSGNEQIAKWFAFGVIALTIVQLLWETLRGMADRGT